MKRGSLTLGFAIVAGALAAWGFTRPASEERAVASPPPHETRTTEAEAALEGSADPGAAARGEADPLAPFVARASAEDANERHAAFRKLKALYEAGQVPLERLVAWALGACGTGNDELAQWARLELKRRKPASLALMPKILAHALGASKAHQDAVAQLVDTMDAVRAEDVPSIVKLFEDEKTEYWLKRVLVEVMDDVGAPTLPLAPHLMDWITEVLRDRQQAMKKAMEAGIHVSWDHVEYDVERLLGSMGDGVVPILVERLRALFARPAPDEEGIDELWEPESVYADALGRAGERGIQALIVLLDVAGDDHHSTIVHALAWVDGPNEVVRGVFLRLLREGDAWTRTEAAKALAKHGTASIPTLLEALQDKQARVRKAAAQSLKTLKVSAADSLDALRAVLEGDDRGAALQAAETIAGFGREGLPALPRMIANLDDETSWGFAYLARAVGLLGVHGPGVLTGAYPDAKPATRRGLVLAARSMPLPLPQEILPMLEAALRSPDGTTQILAAELLMRQGHKDALAPLIAGFDAQDPYVRILATAGLAHAGAAAAPLLPRMLERVGRDDLARPPRGIPGELTEESALDSAIQALGCFDFPRVFGLIDHDAFDVYYAARQAFEQAGADGLRWLAARWDAASEGRKIAMLEIARHARGKQRDKPEAWELAQALIRRAFADASLPVRSKAVDAAQYEERLVAEVLPVLIGLLRDAPTNLAHTAAYRLSALGAKAAPIEAELRTLQKHPDETVQRYVLGTLDAIEDAKQKARK